MIDDDPTKLKTYRLKRDFATTPEPSRDDSTISCPFLRFVVHWHHASREHYDLRLEWGGVFHSWAVPKGPTLDSDEKRLAVHVENHPLDYGYFEGVIPVGQYGAGLVMIWDSGQLISRATSDKLGSEEEFELGLQKGHLTFCLSGERLAGEFSLIRLQGDDAKNWLLLKKRDGFARKHQELIRDSVRSVATVRTMAEIANEDAKNPQSERWANVALHQKLFENRPEPLLETPILEIERPPLKPQQLASSALGMESLEAFPNIYQPMQSISNVAAFDDDAWCFHPEPQGPRGFVLIRNGHVQIRSPRGRDWSSKYPTLVQNFRQFRGIWVLDGYLLEDRLAGSLCSCADPSYHSEEPAVFLASDVLHCDQRATHELAFEDRCKILLGSQLHSSAFAFMQMTPRTGTELLNQIAQQQNLIGILAKHRSSRYLPGIQSTWLSIAKAGERAGSELRMTHSDKILWTGPPITKLDYAKYLEEIAPVLLPHLADRPLSLRRFPHGIEGESFFQKDVTGYLPRGIETISVHSSSAQKTSHYLLCQNAATLRYLANIACLEIHPWLARHQTPDRPDFVVFDLDPADDDLAQVVEVALALRRVLEEKNIASYPKTSGSRGLHVAVPLAARFTFEQARQFAWTMASAVVMMLPDQVTLERTVGKRKGRLYLDTMQNRSGQTLAAPYGTRARPGAPVSMPIQWDAVTNGLKQSDFTIKNALDLVNQHGDLWQAVLGEGIDITAWLAE